ncbi:MAG: IS5 family transposase [Candidatus Vogelbacteria bacterium]|nr:IS5 family transposase [Candidatus Vogelbacteria bacterium]
MQQPSEKTGKLLLATEEELFNTIIDSAHPFRRLNEILDFESLVAPMRAAYSTLGAHGIDAERGVKALLIQFWENYSDREMEKAIRENLAIRWFCGFGLTEHTPDYSYFSKLRTRLGTKRVANLFKEVNAALESRGLFGNVFTFIDASSIITKTALWEERDRAIKDGAERLNNKNVKQYAADKDARWGAKSKTNIWFGHKRHTAVDMRHGLVKKVAVTAANVPDFRAARSVVPTQGAVFTDKIYDTRKTNEMLRAHLLYPAPIRKNNNPSKNRDLDRWRSAIRMPFEGTFSKMNKRARYRGHAKVTLQCFFEAIAYNLKKSVRLLFAPSAPAIP